MNWWTLLSSHRLITVLYRVSLLYVFLIDNVPSMHHKLIRQLDSRALPPEPVVLESVKHKKAPATQFDYRNLLTSCNRENCTETSIWRAKWVCNYWIGRNSPDFLPPPCLLYPLPLSSSLIARGLEQPIVNICSSVVQTFFCFWKDFINRVLNGPRLWTADIGF